jgi:hypothetical protein
MLTPAQQRIIQDAINAEHLAVLVNILLAQNAKR